MARAPGGFLGRWVEGVVAARVRAGRVGAAWQVEQLTAAHPPLRSGTEHTARHGPGPLGLGWVE
eukprot:14602281-Alexandrium_andersonii.AAC.1